MAAVASGMTIRGLPKTFYDFTNLKSSSSMSIMLFQHLDVSVFQEVSFLVRAHGGSAPSSSLAVNVLADAGRSRTLAFPSPTPPTPAAPRSGP
jgi:hypothetical protein